MVHGPPGADDGSCRHCGSTLRTNAPFCVVCGQAVTGRIVQRPTALPRQLPDLTAAPTIVYQLVGAGRGVRCACYLLDLAVMLSPALPLAIAGAVLGVSEIVYIVVPIAFVAVWVWMQIWQGFTGTTFGKSMLGLRLIQGADQSAPGFAASVIRGAVFFGTAGLAALPVFMSDVPRDGLHDRLVGLTMIDVAQGANPLGRTQDPVLRRSADRGLNTVAAPLPTGTSGRH